MTNVEKLTEKILKKLRLLSWTELEKLKINGQQIVAIKNGKTVRFYKKTLERLVKHFNVA